MKRITCSILAAIVLMPAAVMAQTAYTRQAVNLRTGPDAQYPPVLTLPAGASLQIYGCINDYSWCDVSRGPDRGWVSANYIDYVYNDQRVVVYNYGPQLGLPILAFALGAYWDNHYRNNYWYAQRGHWNNYHPVYPPRPPYHGHPPGHGGPPNNGHPPKPGYRPPNQGGQPGYRPPNQGGQPGYRPPSQGGQPGYRPPPNQGGQPGNKPNPGHGGSRPPQPQIQPARPPAQGNKPPSQGGHPPQMQPGRQQVNNAAKPMPNNGKPPAAKPQQQKDKKAGELQR